MTNNTAGVFEDLKTSRDNIVSQLRRVIVGLDDVFDTIIIACFTGGHCLLEGPSGLAKTSLINALASTLELNFKRIQFTPDLMPSDIIGNDLYTEGPNGSRRMEFSRGPIFANVILADEINRATPKTQAALLQAMQEKRVTHGLVDHLLEEPFLVLATQNPQDQEGTYPLPEAQLDRFLFKIVVPYPSLEEEIDIITRSTSCGDLNVEPVLHRLDLIRCIEVIKSVSLSPEIKNYIARLLRLA